MYAVFLLKTSYIKCFHYYLLLFITIIQYIPNVKLSNNLKTSVVFILLVIIPILSFTQVKIGDNQTIIYPNSILEFEINNKAFVLTSLYYSQFLIISQLPISYIHK